MNELNEKHLPTSIGQLVNNLTDSEKRIVMSHKSLKKIREYDLGDFNELTRRLYAISRGFGVRMEPSVEMVTLMLETLKNQFADFSMQEIAIAFEFSLGGKIDVETNTYDSFNVVYLTNVLKAYREYRIKIIKKDLQINANKQQEEKIKTIEMPVEEKQKRLYLGILKIVETERKIPLTWDWEAVFFHLERIGELCDSNKEKTQFMDGIILKLKSDAKMQDRPGIKAEILERISKPELLKFECRKERVKKYLQTFLPVHI